jgi:hypothetical protein
MPSKVWPLAPLAATDSISSLTTEVNMFVRTWGLPYTGNPYLTVAWRWRRSGYLLRHGRQPLPQLDDELTEQAWRFRLERRWCETEADWRQLAEAFPDHMGALQLRLGPRQRRWQVEARLLAGQDDAAIAACCAVPASVIKTYHDLYYHVRRLLKAEGFIICQVIGWPFGRPVSPLDQEKLVKLFAYNWGGAGVDAILQLFAAPPVIPDNLGALDLATLTSLRARLGIKLLVQIMATPAEALPALTWLELSLRWRAALTAAQSCGEDRAMVLDSIRIKSDMVTLLVKAKASSEPAAPGDAASIPAKRLAAASPRCAGPAA